MRVTGKRKKKNEKKRRERGVRGKKKTIRQIEASRGNSAIWTPTGFVNLQLKMKSIRDKEMKARRLFGDKKERKKE